MLYLLTLALILLVPLVTYLYTFIAFKFKQRNVSGLPPVVPYWFPFLAHTSIFAAGDTKLENALKKNAVYDAAVRFKGIGFNFLLISGANLITKVLSTNHFDWNAISAPMLGNMFDGTEEMVEALRKDDSGIGVKPYPGSNIDPGRRLMRNQVIFFSDAFSKKSLNEIVPRFVQSLENWCDKSDVIGESWTEQPDLVAFVREVLFQCGVEAFFGPSMLTLNPNLSKDFSEYDDNIRFLALGLPGWMRPNAVKARTRVLDAMKLWRRHAEENTDPTIPNDVAWDPAWGFGAIRRRNRLFDATDGLFDEHGRATTDTALLWALTSNVIPAAFWYLIEILTCDGLLPRVMKEVEGEIGTLVAGHVPKFDPAQLTSNALLQSIFAETLRLHVATLTTRTVKKDHTVGSCMLQKGQDIIISSNVEHMRQQWETTTPDGVHPALEFYPDRFLSTPDGPNEKPVFSLDGRHGQWIPFGMGEHLCPGRHFARQEMIINAAMMLMVFDIELLTPKGWRPANSFGRYGFGTQHAAETCCLIKIGMDMLKIRKKSFFA